MSPALATLVQVKLSTGHEKKAAAVVLRALHGIERQSWHVPAARRLLNSTKLSRGEDLPSWLLEHAVLWWPELLQKASKLQDFMAQIQQSYRASLSPCDLLHRLLLCAAAGGADSPWGFRHWAQQLKPWSSTWQWDLDQRRVRATAEHFAFDSGCESLSDCDGAASQALGATLSAVMCGGALELCMLGTACSDATLRACAFEAGRPTADA
eukprot:Skav216885  [mRNA]  locus=scaffold1042:550620:551960:+ [translate_table: standard]